MAKIDRESWDRRDRKQLKRKHGMRLSGRSVKTLLQKLVTKKAR